MENSNSALTAVEIGHSHDLFFQSEISPGSIYWKPRGAALFNNLISMIKVMYDEMEFREVVTPNIFDKELWKISGHWWKYRENMFIINQDRYKDPEDEKHGIDVEIEIDENEGENKNENKNPNSEKEDKRKLFALKAMNCPCHCQIFKTMNVYSKDLPIRLAEFGVLHRNECSGSLHGLTRVRRFQQDDAHIFCRTDQIQSEVFSNLKMIKRVYDIFGLNFECELSTRPEQFIGTSELWDEAENQLRSAIVNYSGTDVKIKEGDGAFYGPKIDISLRDSLGRKIQCGTIQLDFNLPSEDRFNLTYLDENDNSIVHHPVIIHRAVLGSVERFIGIILEVRDRERKLA